MKLTKAQKDYWRELMFEDEQWPVDPRTATEIIEDEIKHDIQAHRAYDLFERLVKKGDIKHAQQLSWILWKEHGIEVGDSKDYKYR